MSFSVSSQTDSLLCFTQGQVKTFLLTKTELNNCLEQYNAQAIEINALAETNDILTVDIAKTEDKSLKRKKLGLWSTIVAILEALGIFLLIK